MNTFTDLIGPSGPLIPVEITLSAADALAIRQAGGVPPAPVAVQALIDSGADVTVIDPSALTHVVATGVGPRQFHFVNAPGAGGMGVNAEYSVGLRIAPVAGQPRSGLILRTFPVTERSIAALGYQALIGRDIISKCLFLIDGPGGRFTLGY